MEVLRTGWDIDGVGFTFGDSCKNHLDHTGRGQLWKSGPTPKPFWNWYRDWGWTDQDFIDFCHEAADCGCLFTGPVREGYAEAIEKVRSLGHQIIVVTDRSFGKTPEVSEDLTKRWFLNNNVYYDELHFSADKARVYTDTFIDDKVENYDRLVEVGCDVYLLNRPWNEEKDDRVRIDSVTEYADLIQARTNGLIVV